MSEPILTVVVVIGDDTLITVEPTLRSVRAALAAVSADGSATQVLQLEEAGQASLSTVSGSYIAVVPAGDLVSEDYFVEALARLRAVDAPTIVHPGLIGDFGAICSWRVVRSSDDPGLSLSDVLGREQWPSTGVAHRSTWALAGPLPGADRALVRAEQLQVLARGGRHEVAAGTAVFRRVEAPADLEPPILPPIDLEALRRRYGAGAAIAADAEPVTESSISSLSAAPVAQRPNLRGAVAMLARRLFWMLPLGLRQRVRSVVDARRARARRALSRSALERISELAASSARFEPQLRRFLAELHLGNEAETTDDGYGASLDETLRRIGARARALVVLPVLDEGRGGRFASNLLRAFQADPSLQGGVTVLEAAHPHRVTRTVPAGVNAVQLSQAVREEMGSAARWTQLIAQILAWSGEGLLVGVDAQDLVVALDRYGKALVRGRRVFLAIGDEASARGDAMRRVAAAVEGILIAADERSARIEQELAVPPDRVHVLRQPVLDHMVEVVQSSGAVVRLPSADGLESSPRLRRYTHAFQDFLFDDAHPFRLLVAGAAADPDGIASPDVVGQRARARGVPLSIEAVDGEGDAHTGSVFAAATHQSAPRPSLATLPTIEYHALLTSARADPPDESAVQAMLLGLPVIAASDPDVVVDTVDELIRDRGARRAMIEAGYARAIELYSWESFRARLLREVIGQSAVPQAAGG